MHNTIKCIGLIAILPLLTIALTTSVLPVADAQQVGSGTSKASYGAVNSNVCGDRLCSEYPGGREAFEDSLRVPLTVTRTDTTTTPSQTPTSDDDDNDTMPTDSVDDTTKDTKGDAMKMEDKQNDKMTDNNAMKSNIDKNDLDSALRLARANVPATIPMHMGYYNNEMVHYIITDSSEATHAETITQMQGWKVELAPSLDQTPDSALSKVYFFTNGIEGDGIHGYQNQVFTTTPEQGDTYSALTSHTHIAWIDQTNARELTSEEQILQAEENGEIILEDLPVVLNMPQIMWPGGQMMVTDKTLRDDTPYGGGQILDIDTESMEVTFIAHRGWGPDGRTIYYIVTDATPAGPADAMGVVSTPSSANLIANAAAVDLYQFGNGITGSGPLGFQPGIAVGAPGDPNYSPMWRIYVIHWNDPDDAAVLETIQDINAYREKGLITIDIARPMDSDHIVNCPFIDPFQ